VIGRLPNLDDEEGQVAVLSHWLWNDWFGRDRDVLGQTIAVGNELRTIIGVLPQWFQFPDERISVYMHDLITPPVRPGSFNLNLVGRLAPGATRETLAAHPPAW
jgi:putative ABC transport system permease protein